MFFNLKDSHVIQCGRSTEVKVGLGRVILLRECELKGANLRHSSGEGWNVDGWGVHFDPDMTNK